MLLSGFLRHFKLSRIQSFDKGTIPMRMWCKNDEIVGGSPNWRTTLSIGDETEENLSLAVRLPKTIPTHPGERDILWANVRKKKLKNAFVNNCLTVSCNTLFSSSLTANGWPRTWTQNWKLYVHDFFKI